MDIHPKDIEGASIAVFVWDADDQCGGSAVLFGVARYTQGDFLVERTEEPFRMPIPESAWHNLRINSDLGVDKTFGDAEYIVMLRLGPLPGDESSEGYQKINIPFLQQSSFSSHDI